MGDEIEVVDRNLGYFPVRGVVLELDLHPLEASYAKIRIASPAEPEEWVNLRIARVVRAA